MFIFSFQQLLIDYQVDGGRSNSLDNDSHVCELCLSNVYLFGFTVKSVLRGHIWDKEKVALLDRWPLKDKGQEKCDLLLQVTA